METVERAIQLIKENVKTNPIISKNLVDCLGLSLAEDIFSPIDMPPFPQSAMDGYVVSSKETQYTVIGEIKAGDDASNLALKAGEAFRIFTGAMIPSNAKYVIIQEHVRVQENKILIPSGYDFKFNIRPLGEQLKEG